MTIHIKSLFSSVFVISFLCNQGSFAKDIPTIPDEDFIIPKKREFQLNQNFPACHDFFEYVCSNEISDFKLPESKNRYVFSVADASGKIKKQRFAYIKSLLDLDNLSGQNQMIKNYYSSCMDENARKIEELSLISDYKNEILCLSKEKILEKLAIESLSGNSILVDIAQSNNVKNPKTKDILFSYSLRFGSKDYYFDEVLMKEYQELMIDFFKNISLAETEKNSEFLIHFEKSIAKVYPSKAELRMIETSDNSITRVNLISSYPNIYFKTMLDKIPKKVTVNLITKDVFKQLNSNLKKASLSELQALAIWFRFSMNDIKYSYPDLYKKGKNFNNKYFGSPKIEESLEYQCTQSTVHSLERNLDIEVLNKYYKKFPEQRVKNIVQQIQKTTLENIQKNKWLSKKAKTKAELKISKIRFQVVKPDKIEDWDLKDVLELKPDSYLKNERAIVENDFNKMLREIEAPFNDLKWETSPLTVNAFYNPAANQFVLPLGILQAPFFDENKSDIVNYGSVGTVVAHEIGHSIDDECSRYDELGRLV